MAAVSRRTLSRDSNIWPGFVDALATLLMVIIFALMVFLVAQFYLTQLLSGHNAALDRLRREILELSDLLSLERETSDKLRQERAQLSDELRNSIALSDALSTRISQITDSRDALEDQLAASLSEQEALRHRIAVIDAERDNHEFRLTQLASERDALLAKLRSVEEEVHLARVERDEFAAATTDANRTIEVAQDTIELQLRDLERLRRDIAALEHVRGDLEARILELVAAKTQLENELQSETETARLSAKDLEEARALLTTMVAQLAAERRKSDELTAEQAKGDANIAELSALLTASRDQARALEARLADAERRTSLAQKELEEREIRLEELMSSYELSKHDLTAEQAMSAKARREIELLNRQLLAIRRQLASLQMALKASEAEAEAKGVKIVNLTKRLNSALISRVQELARFRSEFFGRLREVLQNRRDIRIVGDRFVFQAEVLFDSGSADIAIGGQAELQRLATALNEIVPKIPKTINWILQIEGHTDRIPISNRDFRNNWELSVERAISVVEFLISQGVPARRLSATGYGEFQPVTSGGRSIDHRRNRRIEMKLTQR